MRSVASVTSLRYRLVSGTSISYLMRMRLNRVQIKNFRSIADATIPMQPSCRVLVGVNESGKSNILRALALLDPTTKLHTADVRESGPNEDPNEEAFVRFVFELTQEELDVLFKTLSKKVFDPKDGSSLVVIEGVHRNLREFCHWKREILYKVDVRTGSRTLTHWALPEDSQMRDNWFQPILPTAATIKIGNEAVQLSSFSLIHTVRSEQNAQFFAAVSTEGLNNIIGKELTSFAKDKLPEVVFWTYADSNLLPGQILIQGFKSDPSSCMPLNHMFALAGLDNATQAIEDAQSKPNGMRNLLRRVSDAATKHLMSVWKENRGIRINLSQNGQHIDATIEDTFNHYDMSRRSDGFKRFVTFILLVSAQSKTDIMQDTLYLHDEPDISLHPSGARYLRDELIKISAKNYVVYSTHSIFMIDRESVERHLIVRKKKETTSVEAVSESNIVDEEVIYNALGYSIFESLRPMNLVFEGWRDKRLFIVAISGLKKIDPSTHALLGDVGRCHAKGVKDIRRITPMIELASRRCLIISDSDSVARENQRDYDGIGSWFRYDELLPTGLAFTAEDFAKPEAFEEPIEALRVEHPNLPELDIAELSKTEPKLSVLTKWLTNSGVQADDKKPMLNEVKEAVFSNLKVGQIEDKYFALLKTLAEKIRQEVNGHAD